MDHDAHSAELAAVNRRISEATFEAQRLRLKVDALQSARQDASAYRRLLDIADETLQGLLAERLALLGGADVLLPRAPAGEPGRASGIGTPAGAGDLGRQTVTAFTSRRGMAR